MLKCGIPSERLIGSNPEAIRSGSSCMHTAAELDHTPEPLFTPNESWSRQLRAAQGITARNCSKGSCSQTRVTTCKATETTTSPRTPVHPQGFQKAFSDGLQPSPASQPEIPPLYPPLLSTTSQGDSIRLHHQSPPHTPQLSAAQLCTQGKKPPSSRTVFSRAPEVIPGRVTTSKLQSSMVLAQRGAASYL